MTTKYAQGTSVPVERSIAELKRICEKYGASNFGFLQSDSAAAVFFKFDNRMYRMDLHFQSPSKTVGISSTEIKKMKAEERRKWRVLILTIKAMFVSIESEVFDSCTLFQPFTLLPDNTVIGERMNPQIEQAYQTGRMPIIFLEEKS